MCPSPSKQRSIQQPVSLSFALSMWLSSRGKSALELALSSSSRSSPAFRNALVMVDSLTLLHAVRIHWQTSRIVVKAAVSKRVKKSSGLYAGIYGSVLKFCVCLTMWSLLFKMSGMSDLMPLQITNDISATTQKLKTKTFWNTALTTIKGDMSRSSKKVTQRSEKIYLL